MKMNMLITCVVLLISLKYKTLCIMGSYKDGYLNNMKKQTIVFDLNWGEVGGRYHMKSFIRMFRINNFENSGFWSLETWLFE